MTAPRRVLPGTTYLVTRRCAQRQFLLKPSAETNALFRYLLALASCRFGIRIHAFCVLSNHFHLVVTDPHARLPAFEQYLDSLVARAVNASLGRWEAFWAPSSYSAVTLLTPDDVVDKAAYVLANPVLAGLVQRGRAWPGLWSAPESIGSGPTEVPRPTGFFRANGPMPEAAQLELTAPPGFSCAAEFRDRLIDALEARERDAAAERASAGEGFVGRRRVLAQDALARPETREPRRSLSPRVATRDKWRRMEALSRLAEFVAAYREALAARKRGVLEVLFPAGTYWMRVAHGVRCCGFA